MRTPWLDAQKVLGTTGLVLSMAFLLALTLM